MADARGTDRGLDLTIVVVSWNCRDLTLACLRNLVSLAIPVAYELIVVDNGSGDGTAEAVDEQFASAIVIRCGDNLGFAAANNIALARARGRFWLLLNPDAFPSHPDAIVGLLRFLERNPRVAAAGPRLLNPDGTHQVGDAGFAPTLGSVAVHAFSLMRLSGRFRGLFLTRISHATPFDVDWVCGACMVVRAEAAATAGTLDPTFFMYGEDMEWGCRLRDRNWRVVYLPGLSVLHLRGGTQTEPGGRPALSVAWLNGLTEVYRLRNQRGGLRAMRAVLTLAYASRAVAYALHSVLPGRRQQWRRAVAMAAYAAHSAGISRMLSFGSSRPVAARSLAPPLPEHRAD